MHLLKRIIYKLALIAAVFLLSDGYGQGTNFEYERLRVGEAQHMLSRLTLHPDKNMIAVASTQSFPLYFYNWNNTQAANTFDVINWYAGSRVQYSKTGRLSFIFLPGDEYVLMTHGKRYCSGNWIYKIIKP